MLLVALTLSAATDSISYLPVFHGTFRGRYEQSTVDGEQRFQVRNARLSVAGIITPRIDYFVQTDLCDRGKMKILDAWGRFKPSASVDLQMGQFRMPFGVESFLAPHTYYFANRSYMGKAMCNYRAVGAKAVWRYKPLTVEAGVFNPNTISDHEQWHRPMAYSAKASWQLRNVLLSAGFMSIEPDSVRANLADVALRWHAGRWTVAAEYMYEHYTNSRHKASHSYVGQVNYAMPVRLWEFNSLSFQARFDGITAQSDGKKLVGGRLTTTQKPVNRITAGSTISHIHSKSIFADLRVNYEKMFFHKGVEVTPDMGDKLVVEMVLRF